MSKQTKWPIVRLAHIIATGTGNVLFLSLTPVVTSSLFFPINIVIPDFAARRLCYLVFFNLEICLYFQKYTELEGVSGQFLFLDIFSIELIIGNPAFLVLFKEMHDNGIPEGYNTIKAKIVIVRRNWLTKVNSSG